MNRTNEFRRLIAICIAAYGWVLVGWLAVGWITDGLSVWLGGPGK